MAMSDTIFGCLEKGNQGGAGLALEVGAGHVQGKRSVDVEDP